MSSNNTTLEHLYIIFMGLKIQSSIFSLFLQSHGSSSFSSDISVTRFIFSGTCRDGEVLKLESFAKCTDYGCTCKSEVSSSNREIVTSDAHGSIYVKLWVGLYHDRHSELVKTDFILWPNMKLFFQCGTDSWICKVTLRIFPLILESNWIHAPLNCGNLYPLPHVLVSLV